MAFTDYETEQLRKALLKETRHCAVTMLISTNLYNEVTVSPHLDVSFDNVEIVDKQYTIPEGSDEGLKKTTYEGESACGDSCPELGFNP